MIAKVSQAVRAVHGQQTACKGVSQMAKKYILKIKDIHKKRAMQWAYHYDKREIVKQISPSLDVHRIITIIQNYIPAPELLVDGSLLNGRPHLAGIRLDLPAKRTALYLVLGSRLLAKLCKGISGTTRPDL
jgi:hypothetical protein